MLSICLAWKIIRNCHFFLKNLYIGKWYWGLHSRTWILTCDSQKWYVHMEWFNVQIPDLYAQMRFCACLQAQISLLFLKNQPCKLSTWSSLSYFCYAVLHSRSSFYGILLYTCILNRRSGVITASLLSYISFFEIEIISWMQCLFCLIE